VKNELGRTFVFFDTHFPLCESVREGNIKMVKYLVRKGADIHYWNGDALGRACWRGHFEIVKFLVENGAVIHARQNQVLRSICSKNYSQIHDEKNKGLRWVHNRDFFETVKYLIDRIEQAQINHAFLIIVYHGLFELAKYLIRKGADIHAENDSALWCASHGHLEIVKYLVRHGADVHAHNESPLIEAVVNNHLETVKYLVRHGADVHARQDYALREACAGPFFGSV
jgi:ankyrin repeat protein